MGWGIGDLSATLLGYDKPDDIKTDPATVSQQFKDILNLLFTYPQLFQGLQMAAAVGQNPTEYLGQFIKDANSPEGQALKASGTASWIPGNKYIDTGALAQANTQLAGEYESKQVANFQGFYDKLGDVPALSGLFSDAKGEFSQEFTKQINTGYEQMAGAALGTGAVSGFLADPAKQAKILGPLALQKAQYLKDLQMIQQGKALSLAGAGGLVGASQNATTGLGVSPFTGQAAAAAGMFGGFNQDLSFKTQFANQSAFNSYQQAGLAAQMQGFQTMFAGS